MHIAIVILARGRYSKRIKNKPLVKINKKTLIEYTLDVCDYLEYPIWVYTDLDKVKKICKKYKVNVRDKKYESETGAHQTTRELKEYNNEIQADVIILLQVTSPFRNIKKVKEWIQDFNSNNYDCGLAAYKDTGFYYEDNKPLYNIKERDYNSKEIKSLYKETGSFYIFKVSQLDKNHITNGKIKIYEDIYNIDINTQEDLRRAKKCI